MASTLNKDDLLLKKFSEELELRDQAKFMGEKIIEEAGTMISLLHRGKVKEARKLLVNLKKRIEAMQKMCYDHPRLFRLSIIKDADMEFVEATCYFYFITENQIPPFGFFTVDPDEYVLGLADLVGELRRRCLDSIRLNKLDLATKTFEKMTEIYEFIWKFEYPKKLVKGLRHKIDVDRKLLEDTRLILTQAHILLK